jgi:methionyl aminopeptidase
MSIGRNDSCWCGSGVKYKKCHMNFDEKLESLKDKGHIIPTRNLIKNKEQIDRIKKSAEINNALLDYISDKVKEGITTEEIDKLVYEFTVSRGAIPAPLNYGGFPKSVCTSINDVICHGIPSKNEVLKNGDIVNIDVSTILNGYFSDASRMFAIGEVSEEARNLVNVCKECLYKGIEAAKPWGFVGDIGAAIQEYAESKGYSVVRDFGGHGLGVKFQEEPFIPHFGKKGQGMVLTPGMMITIEPMINTGDYRAYIDEKDGWTARTVDGSLSAQWEHMLLITEDGVEIISK